MLLLFNEMQISGEVFCSLVELTIVALQLYFSLGYDSPGFYFFSPDFFFSKFSYLVAKLKL